MRYGIPEKIGGPFEDMGRTPCSFTFPEGVLMEGWSIYSFPTWGRSGRIIARRFGTVKLNS